MEIKSKYENNENTRTFFIYSKDIKRLYKFCLILIIINTFMINNIISRKAKSHLVNEEEFPELTEEELIRAKQEFLNEEDPNQKGFLEPVVKPEIFDLNKDRKISKEEIKKAIKYCIFPKESSRKKIMREELKNHVNNQVDVFVDGQIFENLNYKQFGKFMNRIQATDFINMEIMANVHMIPKDYREIPNDL